MTHPNSSKPLPSIDRLKEEARLLRDTLASSGNEISHSAVLEHVARLHGYRDWNTVAAKAGNRPPEMPLAIGDTVGGSYLGKQIIGTVLGVHQLKNGYRHVTIELEEPVDVVSFESFSNFRSRINVTVDAYGVTPAKTSDGHPHLKLDEV